MIFQIGKIYRNRKGKYKVLSIDGPNMVVLYQDGQTQTLEMQLQAHIFRQIMEEVLHGAEDVDIDKGSRDYSGRGDDLYDLVTQALRTIAQPYPPNVTDQVCLAIERRPEWLAEYNRLVKERGPQSVNSSLGAHVRDLTNMVNSGDRGTPESQLIKSYSLLVPSQR
jgi:hypothetical protein